jgi:hypothetical protein
MENQALVAGVERAADLGRNFDMLLDAAPGDQSWIEAGKNFTERKGHGDSVAVDVM